MKRFIGRKNELAKLNDLYQTKGFQMAVIYGRRRIGKSTLITKFIEDKKAIYYMATKVGAERNVELLGKEVMKLFAPGLKGISFEKLEDLLEFIGENLKEEKVILVIDELPFWAECDEGMLSVLQKFIDQNFAEKELFLILCGSSLSFMEEKVLSEKSPLFGRRTAQLKIREFNYLEAAEFVPEYSYEDKALCYGITGGVAKYLSIIEPEKTIEQNIKALFFEKEGYLYDEPRNLLVQEFSDTSLVNNIIEQIASGETSLSVIAAKVHEKDATVLYSIQRLIAVGLIEKRRCITEENNRRKVQYRLKDTMFKFWYTYIPMAVSAIELGKGEVYFENVVKKSLHHYMGDIFEKMCRYATLMWGLDGKLNAFVSEVGIWWGNETLIEPDGKKRAQSADVDIVGLAPASKGMVVGECKYKNEKIDKEIYEVLIRRSKAIPCKYKVVQYLFFSLSGYTEWVLQNVDKSMIKLLTLEDIYTSI